MKKFVTFLLATSLALMIAGCGGHADVETRSDHAPAPVSVKLPSVSDADQFDVFGDELNECVDLHNKTLWRESLDCSQALWTAHSAEMSVGRRVALLELMGRTYSVTHNLADARACYVEILKLDPYWLPQNFRASPVEWREPVLEAYEQMGYTPGRSQEVKNVALLDFHVGDVTPDETSLASAEKAFADYVTAYLEEAVSGDGDGGQPLLNVVSYRDRARLVSELASELGQDSDKAFTADMVDGTQLAQQGRIKRVQAFLQGAIIRIHDTVTISFYVTDVETGDQKCGVTENGRLDDWSVALRTALSECLECLTGRTVLRDDETSPDRLGPMQRAVAALSEYHEALALQEQGRYDQAISHARTALSMRPEVSEFKRLVEDLNFGLTATAMSDGELLPSVDLEGR